MENDTKKLLENISAQMRKGVLDVAILLIVSKKEIYTSEIIEELKNAKLTVVEGTIYPLLSRLTKTELLDYSWEESVSGPPRKYYKLTQKGRVVLEDSLCEWQTLETALSNLKQ